MRSLLLTQGIEALEPSFREALLLVMSQGLTYREAAEITGEPIGTVKWRVSEASRRMRRFLEAAEEDANDVHQPERRADHLPCRR
ncbi:MAG: sigma factor-like helix-turn-helix DNA-binding protein [Armatimonadota bacterium]